MVLLGINRNAFLAAIRARFSCGVAALDDWVRFHAGQDEKLNVTRVFVAIDDNSGSPVSTAWVHLRSLSPTCLANIQNDCRAKM